MLYLVGQWDFDYIFFTESDQVSIDDNSTYDADDDGIMMMMMMMMMITIMIN